MTRALLSLCFLAAAAAPAPAQNLVAIKAGKVITVTHGSIDNAVILIENGVIKQIGPNLEPSWNAKVIDASDKVVMPTYVLAHTSGGMNSTNERMANVPYLTVGDAIDPSSAFFEEALRNGIGTMQVIPGNRTLMGGEGMVLHPYGRTVEDMTVRTKGGLKLSLLASGGGRMAQIRKLRRALEEVRDYLTDYERRKAEFAKEKEAGAVPADKEFDEKYDEKKKAVIDLLQGKTTAYLYVPSAAEVPEALRLAGDFGFDVVLVLGPDCYKAGRRLTHLKHPVVLDDNLEYRETDPETDEESVECSAAELAKLGVPFALDVSTDAPSNRRGGSLTARRYPWWQMATCVRYGVARQTALEALTIVPARILGLEDEIGSVDVGKIANLQILTGDPLQATSWVDSVLLEGEVVYERDKDPRLKLLFGHTDEAGSR